MTPQASHTPGPWMYHFEEPNRRWALIMAGGKAGQIVANVNTESCPDSQSAPAFRVMPAEANARLIAAAPDLLDILITALPYVETAEMDDAYKPGAVAKISKQMRDAITKATQREGK